MRQTYDFKYSYIHGRQCFSRNAVTQFFKRKSRVKNTCLTGNETRVKKQFLKSQIFFDNEFFFGSLLRKIIKFSKNKQYKYVGIRFTLFLLFQYVTRLLFYWTLFYLHKCSSSTFITAYERKSQKRFYILY